MYQVIFTINQDIKSDLVRRLFDIGAGSVSSQNNYNDTIMITALFEELNNVKENFSSEDYTIRKMSDNEWKYKWLEGYKSIAVNDDIYIKSALSTESPPPGYKYIIDIDPRDAFGDGNHSTTNLCLLSLYKILYKIKKQKNNLAVLDIGTGTGILSILSAKMGAAYIDAIDIEEEAIERAKYNIQINSCGFINVMQCDLATFTSPVLYDLVVANILTGVILNNITKFKGYLKDDGILIVSGISDQWGKEVKNAFINNGFYLKDASNNNGWNCFVFTNYSTEISPPLDGRG